MIDMFVKFFIENHIDYIEKRDFYSLYEAWFYGPVDTSLAKEKFRWDQLQKILYDSGVVTEEETFPIRKKVLHDILRNKLSSWIDDVLHNRWVGPQNKINVVLILRQMVQRDLGLDTTTVYDVINDVATELGLIGNGFGYTRSYELKR